MSIEVTTLIAIFIAVIWIVLIISIVHISAKSDEICKLLSEINDKLNNNKS